MKKCIWFLGLALLSLGGCLLKPYVPQPAAEYAVEEGWAIVDSDSLTLFVRPRIYSGDAQPVASNFFSVYVQVKNKSARPLSLNRSGFSVTVNQQQFDPVPLSIVLDSFQSGYFPSTYEDPFAPQTQEQQNQNLANARKQYFELVNSYFSFGDILPNGSKAGFLFYNDWIESMNSFEFDAFGIPVRFARR